MKNKIDFWYSLTILCMWVSLGYVMYTNIEELIKFKIFKIASIVSILTWLSILITELFYRTSKNKRMNNKPRMKIYGSSKNNIE